MVFEAQKPVMSGTCAWKLSEWKYPKLAIVYIPDHFTLHCDIRKKVLPYAYLPKISVGW